MTDPQKTILVYRAGGFINSARTTDLILGKDGNATRPPARVFCNILIYELKETDGKQSNLSTVTDICVEHAKETIYKMDCKEALFNDKDTAESLEDFIKTEVDESLVDYADILAVKDITTALNKFLFKPFDTSKLPPEKKQTYIQEFCTRLPALLFRYDKRKKMEVLRGGRSRKTFLKYLETAFKKERAEITRLEHDYILIPHELGSSSQLARRELTRSHADRARDPETAAILKPFNKAQQEQMLIQQDKEYREFIFSQPDCLEVVAYFAVLKAARVALAKQEAGEVLTLGSGRFVEIDKCIEFQVSPNTILNILHRETSSTSGTNNRKKIREALTRFAARPYAYYEKKTGKRAVMEGGTLFKFSSRPLEDENAPEAPAIKIITENEKASKKPRERGADRQAAEIWRFIGLSTGKYWFPLNFHKKKYSYQLIPWNIFDFFLAGEKNINIASALCMSGFSIIEDILLQRDEDEMRAKDQHTTAPATTLPLPFSPRRLIIPSRIMAYPKERAAYIAKIKEAFARFYMTEINVNDAGEIEIKKIQEEAPKIKAKEKL